MANEFIIKKGLISKANSIVSGSLIVTEGVSGSFSGSFQGDGSSLTGVGAFPFSGSALITGSLSIVTSDSDNNYLGDGSVQGRGLLAVGSQVSASRINSVAFGEQTKANANASFAHGYKTIVEYRIAADQAAYAHAEGWETSASAYGSHAEGYRTQAGSTGINEFGPDVGRYSHAEGWETKTLGFSSHAEGRDTVAVGLFSHAEGQGTISSGSYQHTQGKYNTQGNTTSLMIIGNGTNDTTRSDLALFNTNGIVFNQPLTASVVSGSFEGDGSQLTNLQRPISSSVSTDITASNLNAGYYFRAGGNVTCSIQSSSLVSCNVGSEFEFFQTSSAGNLLFLTGSGVTLNSKNGNITLTGQFSAATLKKVDNDEWDLIGDLS